MKIGQPDPVFNITLRYGRQAVTANDSAPLRATLRLSQRLVYASASQRSANGSPIAMALQSGRPASQERNAKRTIGRPPRGPLMASCGTRTLARLGLHL